MKKNLKYKLASSKRWMEAESSGVLSNCLKIPQGVSLYKLKPGKALLDVIPFVTGKNNPMADEGMLWWERTFHVHRNVGPNQSTYVCPALTANKPCPICEEKARIMKNDPSDEEFKAAKELNPKMWQLVQLRDRNDTDKGIQILALSYYRFGEEVKNSIDAGDEEENLESF